MDRGPDQERRPRNLPRAHALMAALFFMSSLLLCSSTAGVGRVVSGVASRPVATETQTDAARELSARHAPVVYLKEQDAPCDMDGEPFYPSPVESILGNEEVYLRTRGERETESIAGPVARDLFGRDDAYFLDLPGNPVRPRCDYERRFREIAPDPVVYAHILTEEGRDELVLQYWFYFYFNDWNNNHESDWEFIQLVFDARAPEDALSVAPRSVVYSQHSGGERADWDTDKVLKEGERPLVYVAQGSHALQYRSNVYLGKGEGGTGFGCDDASGPSYRVDPDVRLIGDADRDDSEFAWIAFEGRWGEFRTGEFNGPTGPNTKTPWTKPLSWMDDQRDSSVRVPEESIGPNAVSAFCAAVAFGSRLLFGAGAWVVAALLIGAVVSVSAAVTRTSFSPARSIPLRTRRRLGQIMRVAFSIERAEWRTFLGIGVLFVPFGIIAAFVLPLVLELPPLESLVDVIDARTVSAIVVVAIGGAEFGVAYWVVLLACVAAVRDLEAGHRPQLRRSFALVWRHASAVVGSRVLALMTVALLSATIVGIPLSVWLGVRWFFIEQAILIDGATRREARGRSAAVVKGDWWATLGSALAVALLAIGVGPAVGMALLLFTAAPLGLINLVSSVIYLASIPWAAVCFALLYYDRMLASERRLQRIEAP